MMRRYPGLWFVWSPGGRAIHSLLWRWRPYKRLIDRLVMRDIARDRANDPTFEDDMARSKADFAAGRSFRRVEGSFVPSDTWRPDDPQQPDGWRHDGTKWVPTEHPEHQEERG
jgi:hypothetical protein